MSKEFGWAFIGAGKIAQTVLRDLPQGQRLVSVYSRTFARSKQLAEAHGATAYDSLQDAVLAPDVDAVYICTPHTEHLEHAAAVLKLHKPVLCEKPLCVNARQTESLLSCARENGVYLAEAMWTRFNPVTRRVREWVQQGKIGKVGHMTASFGFFKPFDASDRLFDPKTAGGALLDVGIYPLAFAQMVFADKPVSIQCTSELLANGVDGSTAFTLRYEKGGIASLFSSIQVNTPKEAVICGELGTIKVDDPFFHATHASLTTADGKDEISIPYGGYQFEFEMVADEISRGCMESSFITHGESIELSAVMDECRRQIGLRYYCD